MSADGDKSEEATPQKLEEARERGDVAQSREFSNFVIFCGLALCIYFTANDLLKKVVVLFRRYFDIRSMHLENSQELISTFNSSIKDILIIIGPIFITTMVFGVGSYWAQFGFLFTTEKITPDFAKINPMAGLKRMFAKETAMEFVKSVLKVVFVSMILYLVLKGEAEQVMQIGAAPIADIFVYILKMMAKVMFVILLFMGVLAIADLAWQKWSYAQKMKMTVQEIKDEMKQREGDPHIRARIRQLQRDRARSRMMEKVPEADVVVTNPTHVAVALQYTRGEMRAPVVIAKGAGFIALKIKELAATSGVPILERKQLARYLYRNVEIHEPIPESLYTAVAEVLAYVYKMKNKFNMMKKSLA